MNGELAYWVATSAITGVGSVTFDYLLKRFGSLKDFWQADVKSIEKLKIDSKTRLAILSFRQKVNPEVYLENV